jgi:NTE family protein
MKHIMQRYQEEEIPDTVMKQSARVILGGGAAYGLAHIGALQAIEEKYDITGIVGTSMGAMVGALYCIGKTPEQMLDIATRNKNAAMFNPLHLDRTLSGIFDGKKILKLFGEWTNNKDIDDGNLPYAAIAYDLNNRTTVVINQGNLAKAMRASASVPYLFAPFQWNQYSFVDGGVEHPLPLSFADIVPGDITIAVNVLPVVTNEPQIISLDIVPETKSRLRLNEVFMRSVMQSQAYMALHSILDMKPEFVINAWHSESGFLSFDRAEIISELGFKQASAVLATEQLPDAGDKIRLDYHTVLTSLAHGFVKVKQDWEYIRNAVKQEKYK